MPDLESIILQMMEKIPLFVHETTATVRKEIYGGVCSSWAFNFHDGIKNVTDISLCKHYNNTLTLSKYS